MRKRLFGIGAFVVLAATLGMTLATASPAAAHNDACTKAPDSDQVRGIWNFHEACHAHDSCYRNKPYGNDSAGRKTCDDVFHNNMRGWCNNRYPSSKDWRKPHYPPSRHECKKAARTYYEGVRNIKEASDRFKNSGPGTYPYPPSRVSSDRYSGGTGEIFWSRAWDPDGIVVHYEIYRNGKLVKRLDALSFYQNDLRPGVSYRYEIVGFDNHGKRAPRSAWVTLRS